jgi:nucleoside-diphosphate-sugar epimerase
MTSGKTVAVTGATGFVGRYIVRELLERGYGARALVRDRSKARGVLPRQAPGLALVEGDILAEGAAAELVRGVDACIHLIGIIREDPGAGVTFKRMHVEATRAVVRACEVESGATGRARRLIHMSALGADPEGPAPYQKSKWESEQFVRHSGRGGAVAEGGEGLEWTIFRPSLIHGPDGEFVQMVRGLASGQEAPYYFIPYFTRRVVDTSVPMGPVRNESALVSPIAVEDVARAFVAAIDRPQTFGEVYNLVGPDTLTWPELLITLRDHLPGTSRSLVPWGIPGTTGVAVARIARRLGLASILPFGESEPAMAMEDSTAERAKVVAHLGLEPRPFAEAVESYAAAAAI